VTFAVLLRGKISAAEAIAYMITQIIAASVASFVCNVFNE